MTTVLGIDTATLLTSVALARGDASRCEILATHEGQVESHSEHLLALIDRALSDASLSLSDVDAIAVGAGPGSFTGLRIGMATAKGLAFATGKPLWSISSLAALAMHALDQEGVDDQTLVVPLLDARRYEVFAGFYRLQSGYAKAQAEEIVIPPEELGAQVTKLAEARGFTSIVALGDGLEAYPDKLAASWAEFSLGRVRTLDSILARPSAIGVAQLALVDEETPDILIGGAPSYVRLAEAEIKYPSGNPGSFRED